MYQRHSGEFGPKETDTTNSYWLPVFEFDIAELVISELLISSVSHFCILIGEVGCLSAWRFIFVCFGAAKDFWTTVFKSETVSDFEIITNYSYITLPLNWLRIDWI